MSGISTRIAAAATLTALALSLSACGGNDDDKASKAISDQIMKSQKNGDSTAKFLSMKRKDADCIGDGLVDKVGTDKLKKYGVITKKAKAGKDVADVKMSAKDAGATTDVLFKCADVESMMQKTVAQSGQIPKAMQSCVDKALSEDNLRPMFTKVFEGKQAEAQKELTGPMMKCATGSAG